MLYDVSICVPTCLLCALSTVQLLFYAKRLLLFRLYPLNVLKWYDQKEKSRRSEKAETTHFRKKIFEDWHNLHKDMDYGLVDRENTVSDELEDTLKTFRTCYLGTGSVRM